MSALKNYGWLEKVLVGLLALLIADTIIGGPIGLFFRGERHFILAFIFLVSLYLGFRKWEQSSHNCRLPWCAHFLWPFWFCLLSLIWIFAVPVSAGGSIELAVQDAQSLVLLPVASLILYVLQDTGKTQVLLKAVLWLSVVLALCQVGLWLWLEFIPTLPENYYPYIEAFFNTKDSVSIFWQPSPTGGYVRVFWISSIWLAIAVFVTPIVAKKRWVFFMELILGFAICVSYTRGIWLGVGAAMLFCTAVNYGVLLTKKKAPIVQHWGAALMGIFCAVAIFTCVDYSARGQAGLFSRLDMTREVGKITEVGRITEASFAERTIQSRLLLDKWQERPWMGFGYGAYLLDHFSVELRPYLYEMMPFALLMKLGIVGFGLYLAAIFGLLLSVIMGVGKASDKFMLSGAIIAFFLAANTNPVLYSFVGMVAVLFILIWWSELIGSGDGEPFVREVTSGGEVK